MTPDDLSNSYLQQFLDRGVPYEYAEPIALDMAINGGQLSLEHRELARFVTETYLVNQDA